VQWEATDPGGIAGASYVLDTKPNTTPGTIAMTEDTKVALTGVPEGEVYFHVRVVDGAGNWGPTTHHRCFADSSHVVASVVSPQPSATDCTSTIALSLQDQGVAGVDPSSIVLNVAGQDYAMADGAMSFNAATGELVWRGQAVEPEQVAFGNQQDVPIRLAGIADFAGNPTAEELAWSFKMDYGLDAQPPPPPVVDSPTHAAAVFEPFEGTLAQGAMGGVSAASGTTLEIDPGAKASGNSSLKATFAEGQQYRVVLSQKPFDAAEIPYLSFDYRVPAGVQVDLVLTVNGSRVLVNFTDNETSGARSRLPGIVADGEWHRVQGFDVSAAARQIVGNVRALTVSQIILSDEGAVETPVGSSFWLDNVAVCRPGSGAPSLSWKTTDPTGIAGYSFVFDDQPGTIPDDEIEGAGRTLTPDAPAPGMHYLHVKAKDGAGHWSAVTHHCLVQQ